MRYTLDFKIPIFKTSNETPKILLQGNNKEEYIKMEKRKGAKHSSSTSYPEMET